MEAAMATVKVSPKYQVVIPREVREELGIKPGEKVQIFLYDGRIEFVPVRKMKSMRGFLKGIETSVARDEDRV
jgi:AbrB family looped-hinge helix DNA binding protein